MKKRTLLFLSILATISFTSTAENLRESIAIVRPNFSESTQTFLTDFSKSLRKDGFVDEDGYGIYKKTTTEYKLAAIISYGGGTLALSLSAEPIQ